MARKAAAAGGSCHKSRGVRLVGVAGQLKRWLVVWGDALQSGQEGSWTAPILAQ